MRNKWKKKSLTKIVMLLTIILLKFTKMGGKKKRDNYEINFLN